MARRRPPRLAAGVYIGRQRYSLTICCAARKPTLRDPAARDIVLDQLRRTSVKCDFAVLAYCMMPDHLHVIAEGTNDRSDGLEFVRLFKQRSGFVWLRQRAATLWQESFYDHVLRSDAQTHHAVRYVLENPVRAKLVTRPDEYLYSGSFVYERNALIEWAFAGEFRK